MPKRRKEKIPNKDANEPDKYDYIPVDFELSEDGKSFIIKVPPNIRPINVKMTLKSL